MTSSPFQVPYEQLPRTLAVFPLAGALLLPQRILPLNIFEPRYLAMILDALRHERMIGMVQPNSSAGSSSAPALFTTGCAGRISAFQESDDGRLLIVLTGVCRFDIEQELDSVTEYRQVAADWSRYEGDMRESAPLTEALDSLRRPLETYASAHEIELPWETLETMPMDTLVDLVSMQFPFLPELKQVLLEAHTSADRLDVLRTALQMDSVAPGANPTIQH